MSANSPENRFVVQIGEQPLVCDSGEDFAILEPVGGILLDDSAEGYSQRQLELMVAALAKYDRPAELEKLRRLIAQRT